MIDVKDLKILSLCRYHSSGINTCGQCLALEPEGEKKPRKDKGIWLAYISDSALGTYPGRPLLLCQRHLNVLLTEILAASERVKVQVL